MALKLPQEMPQFWRQNRIRGEDMLKMADTGDIVFFSSTMFVASMQRLVTASEYDHTAMFLRFASGELIYFESSSNIGVQIFRWDYFYDNKLFKNFGKMAFRKLRCNRNVDKLAKLEEFVTKARGRDYNLNLKTLLKKTCEDDDTENIPDKKTYFCSELVAACHKVLDVLPKEVPSSQYWPSTFTKPSAYINNNLVAKNSDAYYEDMQEIIF